MVIRGGQQPHLWVTVRVPNKGCFLQKPYLGTCRDSDINLVELGNDTVKEDDRVVLLEGGTLRSASPISHSSTIASPVVKLITMDESFFLENRLTLRAILEFGLTMFYFYLCDRTNFFAHSTKYQQLPLSRYIMINHLPRKAIMYLNRHQTEEWKGWMLVLFLVYHYFAATEIYNAIY
ncbi:hypothetical protein M8C21_013011, partial [Ambrosia artemisiifolia]